MGDQLDISINLQGNPRRWTNGKPLSQLYCATSQILRPMRVSLLGDRLTLKATQLSRPHLSLSRCTLAFIASLGSRSSPNTLRTTFIKLFSNAIVRSSGVTSISSGAFPELTLLRAGF